MVIISRIIYSWVNYIRSTVTHVLGNKFERVNNVLLVNDFQILLFHVYKDEAKNLEKKTNKKIL